MQESLMNIIRDKINASHKITEEEFASFSHLLHYKEYPKNTTLTNIGDVENYFYIVLTGYLRLYHIVDGKEHTISFTSKGNTTSSLKSFLKRTPSEYILETSTDVRLVRFSHKELYKEYKTNFIVEKLARIVFEQKYVRKINQQIERNSLTAEERYIKTLKEWPELIKAIPKHQIASYLGIAPESLSRIRKTIKDQY